MAPEMRKVRRSGPSGKSRKPTADEVALYMALARRLYPADVWPELPMGAKTEISRRTGLHADMIGRALRGKAALSPASLAKWEAAFAVA